MKGQLQLFPEPTTGKVIKTQYKTFLLGRRVIEHDNDEKMLACPECGNRVIWSSYSLAIGTKGIRHCPYCGEDMWRENNG